MIYFYMKYLRKESNLKVLDVGSCDVNGTYRPIFKEHEYIGVDIGAGKNVDFVLDDAYKFPFPDKTFDVILCGQVLEHAEFPWETMREISRVAKDGAKIFIVAPNTWVLHRYPLDCYRYNPDDMKALAKYAGLKPIEAGLSKTRQGVDCYMYACKN